MSERVRIKRVFHPFDKWEDAGMWRRTAGEERQRLHDTVAAFMADTQAFGAAMIRVVDEWRFSAEANLTTKSINQQAWVGHAACFLAVGSPEDVTRQAWHTLTQEQQDAANAVADIAIAHWRERYIARLKEASNA